LLVTKSFKDCFVHRVIDGDTILVTLPGVNPLFGRRIPVRLADIQCPELGRDKKNPNVMGLRAKNFTERFIRQKGFVTLSNIKRGKYFRLVSRVSVDGVDLAAELVENGLAVRKKY